MSSFKIVDLSLNQSVLVNLLFHTFIVHFLFEQVTTVETVEGGIHGEELWGVEGQVGGGDSQQSGGDTRELKDRITELERQVESYKKALEENRRSPASLRPTA